CRPGSKGAPRSGSSPSAWHRDLPALYDDKGAYWYKNGVNPVAFIALIAGIAPNLPGFLGTVHWAKVAPFWMQLYNYAWFVGFFISFAVYWVLTPRVRRAA
ncbi:MAG: cytosine permease, partial [Polyangiales bacterium]